MAARTLVFFIVALASSTCTRQAVAERWTGSDENSRLLDAPTPAAGSSNGSYFRLVGLFQGHGLSGAAGKRVALEELENAKRDYLKDLASFSDFKYRYIGLGKRNVDSHHVFVGLGKRNMDSHRFYVGLGKRNMDPRRFYVGLGKRNMDSHRFYVGLGKRSLAPALEKQSVDDYEISIGFSKRKRSKHPFYPSQDTDAWRRVEVPASSFGGRFYETTPLVSGQVQEVAAEYFSDGTDNPRISSLLDKRGMDSYYFKVGVGKRMPVAGLDDGQGSYRAAGEKDKRFLSVRGIEGRRYFKSGRNAAHRSKPLGKNRQLNPYFFQIGLGKRLAASAAISGDSLPVSFYDPQADKSEFEPRDAPIFFADQNSARSWVTSNDNDDDSDDDQQTMAAVSERRTEDRV